MKHIVNVATGTVKKEPLTGAELTQRAADAVDAAEAQAARELQEARSAARQAIIDELLEERLNAPDAPQAVKDYAARRR